MTQLQQKRVIMYTYKQAEIKSYSSVCSSVECSVCSVLAPRDSKACSKDSDGSIGSWSEYGGGREGWSLY